MPTTKTPAAISLNLRPPLPPQAITTDVLSEKYLQAGETSASQLYERVARALARVEAPAAREAYAQRFAHHLQTAGIGAGRVMGAAGTDRDATLINCFVQPVGDCLQGTDDEGGPGLEQALREAATTLRLGGGVGVDFSHIRPECARARDRDATPWGPCRTVDAFDQSCSTALGEGSRRGAQMGVLRIDHPDVEAFIDAKRTLGRWTHFNVSVAVDDAFMDALQQDAPWALTHRAEPDALRQRGAARADDGRWVYRTVSARVLWERIMRAAYDVGEPGVLFIDRIGRDNNLREFEHIAATNPCGEQPLPAYGACVLGPLILPRFVHHPFGHGGTARLDLQALARSTALQVRLLDNVLALTRWPLPQHAREAQIKRRIGVGFTGLGDALVMLGLRYDAPEGHAMARRIARTLRNAAYAASVDLAIERGPFERFDAQRYLAPGTFASRLPAALQARIRAHGIRNSHLLSIAPAGTVSLAFADNCSAGIEPAFAWAYTRRRRSADGRLLEYHVEDHAYRLYKALGGDPGALPAAFVTALQMRPHDHVAMVASVQPYVDAGISKTVNVAAETPYEDFKDLYVQAWRAGLKGLTAYRPNATAGAVLQTCAAPDAGPLRPPSG